VCFVLQGLRVWAGEGREEMKEDEGRNREEKKDGGAGASKEESRR